MYKQIDTQAKILKRLTTVFNANVEHGITGIAFLKPMSETRRALLQLE